jgi:uncharacterized phiE125 gp8 family phage protein
MAQTWDYYLHEFPSVIDLPLSPVTSVASVKYYDEGGVLQTVSSSNYDADLKSLVPTITPVSGYAWPSTAQKPNAVVVQFVAGYAANHPDLLTVREAMLMHIQAHYDRDPDDAKYLIESAEALLAPLRVVRQ